MKDLRNYLKPDEIERILDEAGKTGNERDYLLIRILWKTGLRVSELINLEPSWIDDEDKMITVLGKGNKMRRTPIDRDTLRNLRRYIKDKDINNNKIFNMTRQRVFQIIKETAKKAEIEKPEKPIHPHTLRHSYAVNYLKKGGNLRNLQLNLGHSNLNTTAGYLQVTCQDQREEYEKIMID